MNDWVSAEVCRKTPFMNPTSLLDSVVQLTRHKDADSLALSLLAAIGDLIPVESAAVITTQRAGTQIIYEAQAAVHRLANEDGGYQWQTEPQVIDADNLLRECVDSGQILHSEASKRPCSACFPLIMSGEVVGALQLSSPRRLQRQERLLTGLGRVYTNYLAMIHEAERDRLTGLLNRHSFDRRVERLVKISRTRKDRRTSVRVGHDRRRPHEKSDAWLAVLDIDHFKRVNDTYGHVYGDEVLLILSQVLSRSFRRSDQLFRFGGEEFVILMQPTSEAMAERKLELIRKTVQATPIPQVGNITVSMGYSRIRASVFPKTVFDYADKALYHAKQGGRNQVQCYDALARQGRFPAAATGGIDLF